MRLRKKTPVLMIAILSGFLQIYTGCTQDAVGLDDLASSDAPTNVDNAAGFSVGAKYNVAYPYVTHKGTGDATDNWNESCSVQSTDAVKNITCIIEAKELDLYFNGVEIEFNVPQNMCEYFGYLPPYYYNFEPGAGPSRVVMNSDDAIQEGLTTGQISVSGIGVVPEIYCPYDYSNKANPASPNGAGPNCCTGSYSYVVYNTEGAASTTSVDWGGKVSSCLKGPAMDLMPIASSGYPRTLYTRTAEEGTTNSYVVKAPISFSTAGNFYAANYFVPADHPLSGGIPRAFAEIVGVAPETNPYHTFVCLDRTEEVQASITLMVRDWNLTSEYNLGAAGDPDTALFNDRDDFKDLGDAYPEELFD